MANTSKKMWVGGMAVVLAAVVSLVIAAVAWGANAYSQNACAQYGCPQGECIQNACLQDACPQSECPQSQVIECYDVACVGACGNALCGGAYVDVDGDGVCDNCANACLVDGGRGCAYVDTDGDGVCDNYSEFCPRYSNSGAACGVVGSEDRMEALRQGMGVQRYRAAEELLALDDSLTWEDCANLTMREMRARIAELS